MKKKFAIIGAGVAGLTFSNFLKKYSDHEFTIYEKNESLPLDEGYGIQLSPNCLKILSQINFNKINNQNLFHPHGVDFYNINNKKICELNFNQLNIEKTKYTTLQRSTLIEFLKEDVYSKYLKFGKRIKEVNELKGKVLIKFEDNTNDLVDIVVGADGMFSSTRSFFENTKNEPKFRNAVAIRKILKSKFELNIEEEKISIMLGKNCHVVIYPINKKKELNFVCIVRDKKYDPKNIKSLIDKVESQNLNLGKILEGGLKSWPLYSTPKILPSSNNKVFYIGDAFNGFLPTLAQGAGQSIESAYELFDLIKKDNTDIQKIYFEKDQI